MAGGLAGLLDDVAALAKLAASSIDDVAAASGRASMKAAGVIVDDAAVTPQYVQGLAAKRELPIIKKIVEEHGGTLELQDAEQFDGCTHHGAMAVIRLPMAGEGKQQEKV